ncbi:hypothetical protein R5R35_007805 [Gryllus longicercus]|uniref:Uncharacterized protein n=1 Tax=Gryllus longicercus TaxID=2509291 RepID=A0AAN9W565_9ORTH
MDARGTGQALFDAAAALSESRVPSPDGAPRTTGSRDGEYCNRLEQCCDANCWPSIIVTCFLVVFFVLIVLICFCKYCIKALYESGWATRGFGERRGLLLHAQRTDLPPPYYTVVQASYLPSYEESRAMGKTQLQHV